MCHLTKLNYNRWFNVQIFIFTLTQETGKNRRKSGPSNRMHQTAKRHGFISRLLYYSHEHLFF